jgi:hypothetical protein
MYLKTVGKPVRVPAQVCKQAIRFYCRHLLGDNLYHRISITLEFDPSLSKTNEYAYCDWEFENHKSRDFIITVDPALGKRNMLLALAHEMVHVKQYAKGELKDYVRTSKSKWKGEVIDANELDYWDHPWEIEAHGREKGLYFKFLNSMRKK